MEYTNNKLIEDTAEGVLMDRMNIIELKKKVADGDIDSMNELAHRYMMGIGVSIDYKLAVENLQLAANLGNPLAMANLAIYYAQGVCVDKNIKLALDLFYKAACQGVNIREVIFQYIGKENLFSLVLEGEPLAEYYYALTLGDDEETKKDALLLSTSNKKVALALCALAIRSYLNNPTRDNLESKKWFQQAVDNGFDYYQMLNQIALTEQQIGIKNGVNICEAVRGFIGERFERPFILVKITGHEWAKKLINNGEIFFRSLGKFREISKPGVGDLYEGVANTRDALPFWNEIEKESLFEMAEVGMYDECMAHERIYCLYALEYSKDGEFIFPNIRMRQFGDSAVVIWDGVEFCRRIENALLEAHGNSIWFGHKRVNYDVIFSKSQTYTEFSKTEPFAWQNEYRLVVDIANGRIERNEWNNMTDFAKLMYLNAGDKTELFDDSGCDLVSIGDISDISTMYSIEEFINLNTTIIEKAKPYYTDKSSSDSNHCAAYAYRPFVKL